MLIKFLILLLLPIVVNAKVLELPWDMKLDVAGYAGYKYVSGTAATSFIPSNPELGALLDLQVNKHISFYNQFTYGHQNNTTTFNGLLLYSFAALDFNVITDMNVTLRAGRLRHDLGLYNNSRINPRTRQGVIMPQSIYWDSLNLISLSGDGFNIDLKYKGFELNYTIDSPVVSDPVQEGNNWAPHLLNSIETKFGSHQLISTAYEFNSLPIRVKLDWSSLNLGNNYTNLYKATFPNFINSGMINEMLNYGIEYKGENLTLAAEATLFKPFYNKWTDSGLPKGYSFTASYALTENLTGRINYNEYDSQSGSTRGFPDWYSYAKDINVGLTWHEDNWQVSAEIHKIKGGRWVNQQDFLNDPNSYQDWYMIGTNIVYFFN